MKVNRFLSLLLAGLLQLFPMLRGVISLEAQALAPSSWAWVLKLSGGAVALLGSYDAVSGATQIVSPYTVNATVGTAYSRQLTTSGQTAHSWSATTAPQGSAVFPLTPGLWLTNSNGRIGGVPMWGGTSNITISAWENSGNSGASVSSVFVFTITNNMGPTMQGMDMGSPGATGSFGMTNGMVTVRGSGAAIDGTADAFYFVHQPLQGDGMIVARVVGMQADNLQSEAGVMMRESLVSGARHVFLGRDGSTNMFLRRRLAANATSVASAGPRTNVSWLRLTRLGNTFSSQVSTNGTNWNYVWVTALALPSQLEVGLAVTAHHSGFISTAQFDNLAIGAATPLPGTWPLAGPRIYPCLDATTPAAMQTLGGYPMVIGGVVGDQFSVMSSTNPATSLAAWQSLGRVTNTSGVISFLDSRALTNRMRFYKVQRTGP